MFSYPLTAQCAFCFPALIRLFFLPPPVPQIISRLSVSPPSGLPFLSSATLFSHPGALMLTIISPLFSLLFCFSTLPLCPHHPSTPCPAIIRPPHGGLDCACVCLSLCFSSPHLFNVRLCVILPCLCISGLTEALSSHKPFQSATLSPRPHTRIQTHNLRPPTGRRQPPRLNVPKQQVLAGKMPTPPFSLLSQSSHLQHPLLVFLAQANSKNNVHCQREVGGRAKAPLVVVCRTLHIQIQPAARLCRLREHRMD